jgi:ABC-type Fe3+ transport system substrate-binding protein
VSESPAEPSPGAEVPPASATQLIEELRKAKVSDLLVHTSSMLASLAFGKLAPDVRDLDQARLAIDALKALGPLLDEGPQRDIQQVVANLQLAYAAAIEAPPASE